MVQGSASAGIQFGYVRHEAQQRALCEQDHRHCQEDQGNEEGQPDHVYTKPPLPIPESHELSGTRHQLRQMGQSIWMQIAEELVSI